MLNLLIICVTGAGIWQSIICVTGAGIWESIICVTGAVIWESIICVTGARIRESIICDRCKDPRDHYLCDRCKDPGENYLWQVQGSERALSVWQVQGSERALSVWQVQWSGRALSVWQVQGSKTAVSVWQVQGSGRALSVWQVQGSDRALSVWQVQGSGRAFPLFFVNWIPHLFRIWGLWIFVHCVTDMGGIIKSTRNSYTDALLPDKWWEVFRSCGYVIKAKGVVNNYNRGGRLKCSVMVKIFTVPLKCVDSCRGPPFSTFSKWLPERFVNNIIKWLHFQFIWLQIQYGRMLQLLDRLQIFFEQLWNNLL